MLSLRARLAIMSAVLLAPVACLLPPAESKLPRTWSPVQSAALDEAAKSVNDFAADLYTHLRDGKGNLIVSPYSINTALAMTAGGAQGNTRAEMEKVLHLPAGENLAIGYGYHELTASVMRPPSAAKHTPELAVANSLWLQKGHPWKKDYLTLARDDFHAGLFEVDFAYADSTRMRINRWVEKETHDHIKDLVPPDVLNANTRIVLANAIYFKALWASKFEKNNTRPEDFTLASGQKIPAPTMYQRGDFWLQEEEGLQVLQLPYDGGATSMHVLLPTRANALTALEQKLSAENLTLWTAGRRMLPLSEVKVWLPKFKFTVPTELAGVLQKMGLHEAFDMQKANFKRMTDHPEGVFISRVIHKAFVETDEVGTEAAAATAVIGFAAAAPGQVSHDVRVKEFRADHPFLFVIKHEQTGALLFVGRVLDPTQ
jgi:serpin B